MLLGITFGPSSASGGVALDSQPQGVQLHLDGPMAFSASTPIFIEDWPAGDYRLRVQHPGVAAAKARLRSNGHDRIVTRSWAGPGALAVPPGFAHLRRGDTHRGFLFLGAGAAAATLAVWKESSRRDASDEVQQAALA